MLIPLQPVRYFRLEVVDTRPTTRWRRLVRNWPSDTADVTRLTRVVARLRTRFGHQQGRSPIWSITSTTARRCTDRVAQTVDGREGR
jgi:hypothetical protein